MSFMKGDLLAKTRKLMKGGIIARPRWFDAVMRVPPEPKKTRCKKAPKIVLPEDRLVESYYARHPEAKFIPFELNSFDPPPARKFAWRQLELMDDGYPRDVARDMVEDPRGFVPIKEDAKRIGESWVEFAEAEKAAEEEFRAERRRAIMEGREPPAPKKSKIEEIQEEEWEYLSLGLAAIGRDGRKAGERPAGSERPPRVSSFS